MAPTKVNIVEAADRRIKRLFQPFVGGDVNDAQVKAAKFGRGFDWRARDREDGAFLVLRGHIAIDLRHDARELGEGEFVLPTGVDRRPRSLSREPVVLMFEPNSTLNAGNFRSDLTVAEFERHS